MKIRLTGIYVIDPIKTHAFYTSTLGFKSLMLNEEYQLAIVVSPEDPKGTALLLEPNSNHTDSNYQQEIYQQSLPVIVLGVENVQSKFIELIEKGIHFIQKPISNDFGTQVIFDDTCGNLIQIYQD